MAEQGKSIDTRRRSGSAEAALRAQQKRIEAMSIEERARAALSMRERFGWLQMISKAK